LDEFNKNSNDILQKRDYYYYYIMMMWYCK